MRHIFLLIINTACHFKVQEQLVFTVCGQKAEEQESAPIWVHQEK
jgi:hypothetical protein